MSSPLVVVFNSWQIEHCFTNFEFLWIEYTQ